VASRTPTRRIYWTNVGTDTIGRANPNTQKTSTRASLTPPTSDLGWPWIVATSTWRITWNNTIGRADVNGQNWTRTSHGASRPYWVAG